MVKKITKYYLKPLASFVPVIIIMGTSRGSHKSWFERAVKKSVERIEAPCASCFIILLTLFAWTNLLYII